MPVRIYAIDRKTKEETEISENLYFFEEEGIMSLDGDAHHGNYDFRFEFEGEVQTEKFGIENGKLVEWIGT